MGVYKNNKTNRWEWVLRINNEQIRRKSKDWITKKLAKENMDNYMLEIEQEKAKEDNLSPLFEDVVEEYLRNKKLSLKKSTLLRVEQMINRHILEDFSSIRIDMINVKVIQKWQHEILDRTVYNKNEKLLSNRYLELLQGTMKDILNYARVHGYISLNPLEMTPIAYRRTYEPKKKMTILTNEQFNSFLDVVDDQTDRVIYQILYWCGLRSGELIALNIEDYDEENKELHVYRTYDTKNNILTTTKTEHDRVVDLPDVVNDEIIKLLSSYPKSKNIGEHALLGYHTRLPKQTMANRKLKYWLKANDLTLQEFNDHKNETAIIDEFKIPWFTFHELRHTHVSTLIDIGWESKDISDRLGHSVKEVEETYGHLFPKRKKEMFDKLNKLSTR
ncbi:tyrosine-type recombinase/integrase [Erysipelothrix anatis]|uniref:tyrosine-type recombinase/integrase n=1 Tax=Erysipelothrix anatis TaxID=2683713 RepID=UPI0013569459|nr:site-specific integrase [Erysipelothrix anatis]